MLQLTLRELFMARPCHRGLARLLDSEAAKQLATTKIPMALQGAGSKNPVTDPEELGKEWLYLTQEPIFMLGQLVGHDRPVNWRVDMFALHFKMNEPVDWSLCDRCSTDDLMWVARRHWGDNADERHLALAARIVKLSKEAKERQQQGVTVRINPEEVSLLLAENFTNETSWMMRESAQRHFQKELRKVVLDHLMTASRQPRLSVIEGGRA